MLALLMSVAALLLGAGLLNAGNGVFTTFLSVRMSLEGFPTEVTGLVMSAYYVGLAVGTRLCDRIINRVGHIRAFAAFVAVASATVLFASFFISPYVWGAMRGALGFCFAGLFMIVESWLNTRASVATRGRLFSSYMMLSYLSLGGGQLLLNLRDPHGNDFFLIGVLFYCLAALPVSLTSSTSPSPVRTSRLSFGALYGISPLGVLACIGSGLANSALYGMGPVYAHGSGFSLAETSYFMGAAVLSGLLLQYPIGRLSDRYDRRSVIVAVEFLSAAAAVGLVLLTGKDKLALVALVCVYGGFSFTLYPLGVSHANDFLDAKDAVKAAGGLILAWGLGASVGPLAASATMGALGPGGLFVFVAAVDILLALFALWRMTRRPSVPAQAKGVFAPRGGMTPVGAEAAKTQTVEAEPIA
ncbi:MAG TPA: MFS transporter [Alphaproteobacteria bacterium]